MTDLPATAEPDSSALRTALWRALHVQVDPPPHLVEDEIGLALVDPEPGWRDRPDMHPAGTSGFRAAIVARTRFVEDLVRDEQFGQYVLLGAGLDTFAQRHPDLADQVRIFEIDQPATQAWKRQRLNELGYGVADHLHLVPVDFEATQDWWRALVSAGFDRAQRALVSSSGVSMYISKDATLGTLRRLAAMASGSVVAMTFMLPLDQLDPADRPGIEMAARGACASGTPWISFYAPDEIASLARQAGFREAHHMATDDLAARYLVGRSDDLRPARGEGILLART